MTPGNPYYVYAGGQNGVGGGGAGGSSGGGCCYWHGGAGGDSSWISTQNTFDTSHTIMVAGGGGGGGSSGFFVGAWGGPRWRRRFPIRGQRKRGRQRWRQWRYGWHPVGNCNRGSWRFWPGRWRRGGKWRRIKAVREEVAPPVRVTRWWGRWRGVFHICNGWLDEHKHGWGSEWQHRLGDHRRGRGSGTENDFVKPVPLRRSDSSQ